MGLLERIDNYLSEWGTMGVKWKKPHAQTKRLGNKNAFYMKVKFAENEEDPGFDGLEGEGVILISYKTPVALALKDKKFYYTEQKWSVTTTRQISDFSGFIKAWHLEREKKPQEWFDKMWEYIQEKYR